MITDRTAVQNYLLIDIDEAFVSQIEDWIAGVQQEMNKLTNRQLIAETTDADYLYNGTGKKSIVIDDFVSITSVYIDDEDITDDCYFVPANTTPKWAIESDRIFPKGRQNITVTGKKGFATQDDIDTKYLDLKFAATVLVAGIINFSNNSSGEVKSETIGRYSVTYTADSSQKQDFENVKNTIRSYRRMG